MMLLSSKRKFNNTEKTDLIAPEVKRGKISEGCDLLSLHQLHVDENIAHNMQAGGINTAGENDKESAVDRSEKRKTLRKKLLNLKKGKTVRNTKKKKGETESCSMNNYSSTVIGKQCSNKVDDQEDTKDHESSLKCLEHDEHTDVQCCPVCKDNVSMLESDAELNMHINNCLDNSKSDSISLTETSTSDFQREFCFCEICKRDISTYNTVQRQQHYNRCCDNMEETQNVAQKQLSCLVCGKICKTLKVSIVHWSSEQILKYSNNYPALLYYKVEWFDFSATNKIDNLTCVIFHDNLMCVDYHEYCIGVYSSIFVGK